MRKERILSDLIDEISMGPFGSDIKVENFIDSGIPVLNGSNLTNKKLVENTFNYIAKGKADSLKKANASRGDIVITHRGTLGQVSYIPPDSKYERYVISQSQFRVRFNKEVNPIYLTYLFHTDYGQKKLLSFKNHVGVPALAQATSNFKLLNLLLHDKVEQDKIANILSLLDSKIEINNKMSAELVSIAKTLYDYWFVQFDFPDKNGQPYKSSGGKMIYNNLLKRNIPKGWEVKSIDCFIASDKSGDWGKEEPEGNYITKVECIRGADINGINGKAEVKAPTRFILEKNAHKILQPGDLVIEISGGSPTQSTGRLAYITNEVLERFHNPLICSNFCKAVSLNAEEDMFYFVYSWNKAYDNGVFFGFEGKTSGIKNLLFESLVSHYKIVSPDEKTLTTFQAKVSLFEKCKQKNLKQNQQLAELRDWLLPMLMNGQVTVADAFEKIEQTAANEA
jgi:type I restriction enzyme S subunit